MAALCKPPLERHLKGLFIRRSVPPLDNRGVKNTNTATRSCSWGNLHAALHAVLRVVVEGPVARPCAAGQVRSVPRVRVHWVRWAVLALCVLVGQGRALASDKGDHERALQAVQSGQVLPLTRVLALLEREHPGQVLEVELESHARQWQYEIKLLQPDGRLMKLKLDARTGAVLQRKTR